LWVVVMRSLLLCLLLLGGCTHLECGGQNCPVESKTYWGVVSVSNLPGDRGPTGQTYRSVGVWAKSDGIGLGYREDRMIEIPDDCKLVFLIDRSAQVEASLKLAESTLDFSGGEICVSEF
jgi:hypothetical protein